MNNWQSIVETPTFTKTISNIAEEVMVEELIEYIAKHPESGDIIEGTGGCRKIRWQRKKNTGKSGGMRTIYYYYKQSHPIYLLLAYPKSAKDNISQEAKHRLKQMTSRLIR